MSGNFSRFNYRVGHDQGIGSHVSFFNQFTGQMASKNLDSSQKLLLGGPLAVRAYGIGDGSVDKGTIFTTELRTRWQPDFPDWAGYGHQITVAAFFDQGWGLIIASLSWASLKIISTYLALVPISLSHARQIIF